MINPLSTNEEPSVQESLLQLSIQLEHPLDSPQERLRQRENVEQIYQNAWDLLSHISPTPITLARVAGTLLVYQIQDPEGDELKWFNAQIQQCLDEEEVEEVIESIHRIDSL
jgi:hypothetical protein